MSITTLPPVEVFRTMPSKQEVQGVDRENGMVLGASVMQAGALNDSREWDVDDETLDSLVKFGNSRKWGIKGRFTHPGLSSDGLGKHLGRWSNFRKDGDTVRADLKLAEVAFNSPKGDLATYVMDLAQEDPESFGNSVVIELDRKAMDKLRNEDTGRTKLRVKSLRAVDVVDEPAATRTGMFSLDLDDPRDIPGVVTEFLDHHFAGAGPEVISGRLNGLLSRYFQLRGLEMSQPNADLGRKDEGEKTPEPQPQPTPTPEPAPQPAPVQPGGKADEAVKHSAAPIDALAADRQRVKGIIAVCGMAKVPQAKVNEFIDKETPLAEVNSFCASFLSGANPPVPADPPEPNADPDAKLKAEYRDMVATLAKTGNKPMSSEADFIRSRKISTGEVPLSTTI